MNQFFKTWGLLIAALVVGGIAFFVASIYLSNRESYLRDSILGGVTQKREVVVATGEIAAGEQISSQNMAVAEVAVDHLSAAAISPADFDSYDGAILKVPMSAGEPLLVHSVEGLLIDRFSELIEEGDRAVTIEVNTLTSNAGLLSVGDFVDIFVSGTFDSESAGSQESLLPLFQRVRVLAVDRYPLLTKEQLFRSQSLLDEESDFDYSTVTLELAGEQANRLAYAASIGEIVFLLRNSKDQLLAGFEAMTPEKLLSGQHQSAGGYTYFSQQGESQKSLKANGYLQAQHQGRKNYVLQKSTLLPVDDLLDDDDDAASQDSSNPSEPPVEDQQALIDQ